LFKNALFFDAARIFICCVRCLLRKVSEYFIFVRRLFFYP
jgi:hypothetical protein